MVKIVCNYTFVVDTSVDLSTSIGVGNRIKFTDGTVKYFIVVAIAATRITLFGGTDYSIAGTAAVTLPFYSNIKAPFGFPLSPTKWRIELAYPCDATQADPVNGTWYNINGLYLSVPIGAWNLGYDVSLYMQRAATALMYCTSTLSTGNNTESDFNFTALNYAISGAIAMPVHKEREYNISAKTIYYLNGRAGVINITAIFYVGNLVASIIFANCTYL
jgi:hypothetical protein